MVRHFPTSALVLAALALACSPRGPGGDDTADAGPTGNDDAGETQDAGADAGVVLPPCNPGDELDCTGSTAGTCTPGKRSCQDGEDGGFFGPCEARVQPAPGVCDVDNCEPGTSGLNEGCECKVGATRDCYSGKTDELGQGPCRKGFQECVPSAGGSKWGDCRHEITPKVDDCSGRDLDCDRSEGPPGGCSCTGSATRPCGGVTGGTCQLGTQTCTGGTWGPCVGAVQPEPGNCEANSCAGGPNPGCQCKVGEQEACYTSVLGSDTLGTCHAGTRTCGPDAKWGPCAGQASPSPPCDRHFGPTCTGSFAPGCE